MKRRSIISACAVLGAGSGILTATGAACAQSAGKVWRIGYLGLTSGPNENAEAFVEGLRSLGYVQGRNLVIEYRWAAQRIDRLAELAADLVRLNVDVILANGGASAIAAAAATTSIPIVMASVSDPVANGLVASPGRPGRNVTGTTITATDLAGKRIQLLRELLPKVTRIAVLVHKDSPGAAPFVEQIRAAAQLTGVALVVPSADRLEALTGAFVSMQQERAQALIVPLSPFANEYRARIAELAAQHRLPSIFETRAFVDAGGLMSYGPNILDIFRRAAPYVDKIFKGAKPADLPVELPTKYELIINQKTAKTLGITIPQSLLVQAEEVIQ